MSDDNRRHEIALLENMQHTIGVIADGHKSLNEKIDGMRVDLGRLDHKVTAIDLRTSAKLSQIDVRLEKVETRLEKVESRLEKVETCMGKVETRVGNVEHHLGFDGSPRRPTRAAKRRPAPTKKKAS